MIQSNTICLEARLPALNVQRFFNIFVGQNLFGDPYIMINNGRIGTKGRLRELKFNDEAVCLKSLRKMLLKRLRAEKRIGCNYVVTQTTMKEEKLQELIALKRKIRKTHETSFPS